MKRRRDIPAHWKTYTGLSLRRFLTAYGFLLSFVAPSTRITVPNRDVGDALHSNWLRIGADMRTVIDRQRKSSPSRPRAE